MDQPEDLLTPAEVAEMFRVEPKTVAKWVTEGKLKAITTPGGYRRFKKSEVVALLYKSVDPRRI